MAKYVCDIEQVTAIGEKLCTVASEHDTSINDYSSKINGDLSSWTGEAKDNFFIQNDEEIAYSKKVVKNVSEFGEFIKKAAKDIEELEEKLSNMSI